MNKIRKGEVKIYKGKEYIAIPDGVKIVKSENGELCGVGRIPHRLKILK